MKEKKQKGERSRLHFFRQNELISYASAVSLLAAMVMLIIVIWGKKGLPVPATYLLMIMLSICGGTLFSLRIWKMLLTAARKGVTLEGAFGAKLKFAVLEKGREFSELTKVFKVAFIIGVVGLIGPAFLLPAFTSLERGLGVLAVSLMYGSMLALWAQTSRLKQETLNALDGHTLNRSLDFYSVFTIIFWAATIALFCLTILHAVS